MALNLLRDINLDFRYLKQLNLFKIGDFCYECELKMHMLQCYLCQAMNVLFWVQYFQLFILPPCVIHFTPSKGKMNKLSCFKKL